MGAVTTKVFAVPEALADMMKARGLTPGNALAGVFVASGYMAASKPPNEFVLFPEASAPEDFDTIAARQSTMREDGTVEGRLLVRVPGAGEDKKREASDRAEALFAELEKGIADDRTLGGVVLWSRVGNAAVTNYPVPNARVCVVEFSVAYTARLTPGG